MQIQLSPPHECTCAATDQHERFNGAVWGLWAALEQTVYPALDAGAACRGALGQGPRGLFLSPLIENILG
jgi:hypothetical protein